MRARKIYLNVKFKHKVCGLTLYRVNVARLCVPLFSGSLFTVVRRLRLLIDKFVSPRATLILI